jgi:hypothetical protein
MNASGGTQPKDYDELTGTPFDSFRQPGAWEKLTAHPDTRG